MLWKVTQLLCIFEQTSLFTLSLQLLSVTCHLCVFTPTGRLLRDPHMLFHSLRRCHYLFLILLNLMPLQNGKRYNIMRERCLDFTLESHATTLHRFNGFHPTCSINIWFTSSNYHNEDVMKPSIFLARLNCPSQVVNFAAYSVCKH